jgi:hypothetical protein
MTPDMVSAFEGSMVEVEFLGVKDPGKKYHPCILCHFLFRTRPSMSFQQEGYQRGPIHVGRLEMNFRAYCWTDEQIENFKKFRDKEDIELIKSISDTLAEAIDAMGGDLERYLKQAEGEKIEEEKPSKPTFVDRIRAEFLGPKKPKAEKPKKPKRVNPLKDKSERGAAIGTVKEEMFTLFKNFKKAHDMIMW